jgi:hypothetical protein
VEFRGRRCQIRSISIAGSDVVKANERLLVEAISRAAIIMRRAPQRWPSVPLTILPTSQARRLRHVASGPVGDGKESL